jgi:hypothetical protein
VPDGGLARRHGRWRGPSRPSLPATSAPA